MKASLLCGAHYAGASAHRPGVLPNACDPHVAQESFERWLGYAATADELGFDWVSVSEHHYSALTQPKTQAATRLVRKALTDTAPFAWQDEFFDYPNISIWPRPLQQPTPPMYFSGKSLNSAEFAAHERLGLCMSFHRPEAVAK